jgi:hypothetical protein
VLAVSAVSLNADVFGGKLARKVNVPLGPVVERWTSNPDSFVELSCHERSIRFTDTAMAAGFDGAFTVDPGAAARTSRVGSSGCIRSQERESDRIAITMNTGRTTMEPSHEGLLASNQHGRGTDGCLGVARRRETQERGCYRRGASWERLLSKDVC